MIFLIALDSQMAEYELAKLAVSRARLLHALSTARACGDSAWVRQNRPALEELDEKIDNAPEESKVKARELTNTSV